MTATRRTPPAQALTDAQRPDWFREFLTDRATRKPSSHTLQAYRQDFDAIAALVADGREHIAALTPLDINKNSMRRAFATFAESHEAASIRRCWSTWNTLCSFLFTAELVSANPMQLVGKPKPTKTLPKSLPQPAAEALLNAVGAPGEVKRRSEWPERDSAIILIALLAGLRAQEMRGANIGDLRLIRNRGGVLRIRGKGNKDRTVPIEQELIDVLNEYLTSRAIRFPATPGRDRGNSQLSRWPANAPLFVGGDGQRITRGTLQYRVLRAFKLAGPDAQRTPGALVHAFRHTYATELANTNISVYTLMKLLGHESMAASQRYVISAGTENRAAAAQNPLYDLLDKQPPPTGIGQPGTPPTAPTE
jgi:integrase/recombinase XerC